MSVTKPIWLLIFAIVLSGCNFTNTVRMKNANDHLVPHWQENTTEVTLQARYIGEKPYIQVAINGQSGFLFMIDTGASMSYLFDTPKVKALKVKKGYQLKVGGWGDEEDSPVYQTQVKQIGLSQVAFFDVNFAFLPVTKSLYFLREDEAIYDGVLGHDILKHFSWLFDKVDNKIVISSLPYQRLGQETSIEFDTFFSKISIEGQLDFGNSQPIALDFIIDTGSRHYLKVAESLFIDADFSDISRKNNINRITAADFGLSGRTVHKRIRLSQLSFSGLSLSNVKTNLIGGDFEDDNGVIGSALLNQFRFIIDYHSDQIHLIKRPNTAYQTRYNLLGLELRKIRSGEFVVRYIFPDIKNTAVDIKEGDLITKINNKSTQVISQEDWLKLTSQAGTYSICRLRDNETCFTLESKTIEGYSDIP
ncbi:aspartyl protease family protein [Aliikangiella sp. IMCC44632]